MCLGYSGGSPGKQQKKEESFPCLPSGSLESSSTLLLLLLHPFTDVSGFQSGLHATDSLEIFQETSVPCQDW